MKKFLKLFAFAFCFAISSVAFLACGSVALTEENVVGSYDTATVAYTPSGENAETTTYTKAQFESMSQEDDAYEFLAEMFMSYEVKEDGKIYLQEYPDYAFGTWAIEDNELEVSLMGTDSIDAKWNNGKIIISGTDADGGTFVLTLEK